MKIYNEEKTQLLKEEDINYELGHLEESTIHVHIDAVEGVEEQGHYETIKEYPNGGKDVRWVIDVPGIKAAEEQDYDEDILIYIPYTEKELEVKNAEKRIDELKGLLSSTDYKAIKFAEGELSEEEYAETRSLRRSYRAEINQLEALNK